jgi:hypothetical protein
MYRKQEERKKEEEKKRNASRRENKMRKRTWGDTINKHHTDVSIHAERVREMHHA